MKEEKRSVLQMPEDLIVDMNENLPGDLTMEDIQTGVKGISFKVIFYMNEALLSTDFADMDLSVRSSNALKRAGYHTIGELIENIESFSELEKIKNCGKTSVYEISGRLFFYQYSQLSKDKRQQYLMDVLKLNGIMSE